MDFRTSPLSSLSLPLSLALADLPVDVPIGSDVFRAQLNVARQGGFRVVQFNAAAAGLRARELDRSARRDIASILRRSQIGFSGADLWIPPEHFADAARVDRAMEAALGAIELVSDLDRLLAADQPGVDGRVLCLTLPVKLSVGIVSTLASKGTECGVRIADFGVGDASRDDTGVLGAGFDPASFLLAHPDGSGVSGGVIKTPANLVDARLTDAGQFGRVPVGTGRLDVMGYMASLSASGYRRAVVLDVRGLPEPLAAAKRGGESWESASIL